VCFTTGWMRAGKARLLRAPMSREGRGWFLPFTCKVERKPEATGFRTLSSEWRSKSRAWPFFRQGEEVLLGLRPLGKSLRKLCPAARPRGEQPTGTLHGSFLDGLPAPRAPRIVERPRSWPVCCGKRFFCAVGSQRPTLPESGTSSRPKESGTDPSLLEAKRASPRKKMTNFGSRTFKGKLAHGAADILVKILPTRPGPGRPACRQARKTTAKLAALVAARTESGTGEPKRPRDRT
jgi:hypothetical protein